MDQIRKDTKEFKLQNNLDEVILLWTANTEPFSIVEEGVNDTCENVLASISRGELESSSSTIFVVASILESVHILMKVSKTICA